MEDFFQRLQLLDRRWIYLALTAALVVSLLLGKPETPVVFPSAQQLFDAVEQAKAHAGDAKIITLGTTFAGSTLGENGNQLRAVIRHLMLRHQRFAIIAIGEPQGATLGRQITDELAAHYGYKYGVDWIDFGYKLSTLAFFKSLPSDIPGTIKSDVDGKPLSSFPIMKGIKTVNDNLAMHIEVTASASVFDWISLVQSATHPRLKIGYCPTGVMATEAYAYLDSGQLTGMLPGLKGAADYELLVDNLEAREIADGHLKGPIYSPKGAGNNLSQSARQLMFTQGAAHLVIILFILLGNIGVLLARRRARTSPPEGV